MFHTLAGQPDFVEAALRTFFQIHTSNTTGDVLIFLPGQEEIENLSSSINFYARQLPQGVMPVNNVSEPVFPLSHNPSRSLCTRCILPFTRPSNRKFLCAHHMVPGNASLRQTSQKPRLQFLVLSTLSIPESARKGVMLLGNPEAVGLSLGNGEPFQLTLLIQA